MTLFPCGNKHNEKAPRYPNWQQTPFDPTPNLADVFGLLIPPNLLVLDFDPYKGDPDNLVNLFDLLEIPLPLDTFITISPNESKHVHFEIPQEYLKLPSKFHSKVPQFQNIDIRAHGNLVVAAGSKVKRGFYRIYRGDPKNIMTAPQSLLDYIIKPPVQLDRETDSHETDDHNAVSRFITYCTLPDRIQDSSYSIACEGRAYGLSRSMISQIMLEYLNPMWENPISEAELTSKINNAFQHGKTGQGQLSPESDFKNSHIHSDRQPNNSNNVIASLNWDEGFIKGKDAKVLFPTLNNVVNALTTPLIVDKLTNQIKDNPICDMIRYNRFTNQIEFQKAAPWHHPEHNINTWGDSDTTLLKYRLYKHYNFDANNQTINDGVVIDARNRSFHPIFEWLNSLPPWDGTPRLDLLFPYYCGSIDTDYTRAVGKNTILAAINRAYKPGCQHDSMTILEGEQGILKSTFIRAIGGKWYGDVPLDPNQMKMVERIQKAWIFEISELDGITKFEVSALKRFITCRSDLTRMPYERYAADYPRHCIFMATINPDQEGYLEDRTGNRRFWPVWTNKIRLNEFIKDRDQIFAEALHRYRNNEPYWLNTPELVESARRQTELRMHIEPWTDIIRRWIAKHPEGLTLTSTNILEQCLGLPSEKINRTTYGKVRNAMTDLGYKLANPTHEGKVWKKR